MLVGSTGTCRYPSVLCDIFTFRQCFNILAVLAFQLQIFGFLFISSFLLYSFLEVVTDMSALQSSISAQELQALNLLSFVFRIHN
jgi:hypothetical protein